MVWPIPKGGEARLIWLVPAVVLFFMAFVRPLWLRVPAGLWMKFGQLLGYLVAPISMALIFFFTIAPIGLLLRMYGKDILKLRYEPDVDSYWVPRDPPGPTGESLRNQF